MKKIGYIFGLSAMLASLLSFTTPKANAGVITILKSSSDIVSYGMNQAIGGIAIGLISTTGGLILANASELGWDWHVAGIFLIVLDAKQDHQDAISRYLAKTYSFIDDREVLSDLATLMQSKISAAGAFDQSMTVSIPENEVRAVLANASLSAAQAQALVDALK